MQSASIHIFVLLLLIPLCYSLAIVKEKRKHADTAILRNVVKEANSPENRALSCDVCTLAVDGVQTLIKQNKTDEEIFVFIERLCTNLKVEQPHVCKNIIEAFGPEAVFVLTHAVVTPAEICGAFIDNCGHSHDIKNVMWNITIPDQKPPVKPWPKPEAGKPTLRVLHLADLHLDREYEVGSEADCQKDTPFGTYALCCRNYPPQYGGARPRMDDDKRLFAGYWGSPDARCDIPYRTFVNAMDHISKSDKFDYIIVTGDMEAHNMWDYSEKATRSNLDNITAVINEYFPNTPVYQATGNHEGVPMDAMGPHTMPEYETRGPQWLYSNFAKNWAKWLPSSAVPDIQYRASYATRPYPGLKLISLNNIYCSEWNFYLYLNQVDPDGTLQWLIEQLLDSESRGEKVHIIGHIPPGDNYCLKGWSWNFYNIINRFESTVIAQFYAHTHTDSFEMYYEDGNPEGRPTAFSFVAPSLTTYSFQNPAYRVYTVDGSYSGSSFTVLNAETYYTDLSVTSESNPPQWKLEYDLKKEYSMTDLSPASFNTLIGRLNTDNELFKKYLFYYKRSTTEAKCANEPSCKKGKLCDLRVARSQDTDNLCKGL